jgi:hypothetical protein
MDGSIVVSATDRKTLLSTYRGGPPRRGRRAHVLLLLADGLSAVSVR